MSRLLYSFLYYVPLKKVHSIFGNLKNRFADVVFYEKYKRTLVREYLFNNVNPNTPLQQLNRTKFSYLIILFNTLNTFFSQFKESSIYLILSKSDFFSLNQSLASEFLVSDFKFNSNCSLTLRFQSLPSISFLSLTVSVNSINFKVDYSLFENSDTSDLKLIFFTLSKSNNSFNTLNFKEVQITSLSNYVYFFAQVDLFLTCFVLNVKSGKVSNTLNYFAFK